jgi:ATP/maltotriose-dependent transcriptional regulator MalT
MDQGDEDVATFFYYLGLAAKRAMPRKRKPLPPLRPEHLQDLRSFARLYFRELFTRIKTPFVLVFDDYQEVSHDGRFHEVIRAGLDQLPERGNAIFLSRGAPPSAFARLQLNQAMAVLGEKDLHLTHEESIGVARLRKDWKPHIESAGRLNDFVDGWVAGLVLMLEHSQPGDDVPECSQETAREIFFNYFSGEIFDRLDAVTQEFLLKTACLPNITSANAKRLTGLPRAGRIISDMNRNHYFTNKKFMDGPVYQYHPLFHAFLRWRAHETLGPRRLSELYKKAASILKDSGQIEDAAELYLRARDWTSLSELICMEAPFLLSQGRFGTLEKWVKSMPEEVLVSSPYLIYWLGYCRLPFDPIEGRDYFARSFELFRRQQDRPGMFLSSCGVIEAILTEWGDFKHLDPWITIIDGMLKESGEYPSEDIEARVTFAMFSALMFRQPDHPDMQYWEDRALELIRSGSDITQRVLLGGYLAHYRFWVGDIAGAGLIMETVRQLARASESSPLVFATWKMQEAVHSWHLCEFDTAIKTVEEGLRYGEESGVHILDNWLLAQGVYASLSRNYLVEARRFLDKMKPVLETNRHLDICHYHYLSSLYNLLDGSLELAMQHSQRALKIATEIGTPFPEGLNSITAAQIMYELGETEKAARLSARARQIGLAMKSLELPTSP